MLGPAEPSPGTTATLASTALRQRMYTEDGPRYSAQTLFQHVGSPIPNADGEGGNFVQFTPNREASLLSQLLKEKYSGVPDTPTLANAANAAQSDTPLAMLKTLACLAEGANTTLPPPSAANLYGSDYTPEPSHAVHQKARLWRHHSAPAGSGAATPYGTPSTNESSRLSLESAITASPGVNTTGNSQMLDDSFDLGPAYSRKDKSLSLLCNNFLANFARPDEIIPLDRAAETLRVERRRIYDIVNVLESIEAMERSGKNAYRWVGLEKLGITLAKLKAYALAQREEDHMNRALVESARQVLGENNNASNVMATPSGKIAIPSHPGTKRRSSTLSPGLNKVHDSMFAITEGDKRGKSLGVLSQQFLMLFLLHEGPERVVTLDDAARLLIGINHADDRRLKTKVRRLYDIANIFLSLKLISKLNIPDARGRKPAFSWIGRDLDDLDLANVTSHDISELRVLMSTGGMKPTSLAAQRGLKSQKIENHPPGRKLQRMGTWHGPVGPVGENRLQSRSAPDGFQPVPLVKVESEPSLGSRIRDLGGPCMPTIDESGHFDDLLGQVAPDSSQYLFGPMSEPILSSETGNLNEMGLYCSPTSLFSFADGSLS